MAASGDRSQTERGFATTTNRAQVQPAAEARNGPTRLKAFELVRNSVYTVGALFFVAIAGVVVVGFTGGGDTSTISTMLTAVTGVIGALVGAYFGVQVGNEGRQQVEERAEERRRDAEERLNKALAMLPQEDAAVVLGMESPRSEPREQEEPE